MVLKKFDKKIHDIYVAASVWPLYPIFLIAIYMYRMHRIGNCASVPILPSRWSVFIKSMFDIHSKIEEML